MNGWLLEAWKTTQDEFSDLGDIDHITRVILRLSLASILGGILGFEREQKGKSAGVRTHMLVASGAALFILIPQQAGVSDAELMRVMQGLVAGIGFLGAGSIIKVNDRESVTGLTTAAGIWFTAAIGVAAGMGRQSSAVLSTFLALAILSFSRRFQT
ncbi:MAG: MgtC/SapB family protein [Planctomycetota bacterium]